MYCMLYCMYCTYAATHLTLPRCLRGALLRNRLDELLSLGQNHAGRFSLSERKSSYLQTELQY
jgi:hypothetical protein